VETAQWRLKIDGLRLRKAHITGLRGGALDLDHAIVSSRRRNAGALEAKGRAGFDRGEISLALGGSREINILLRPTRDGIRAEALVQDSVAIFRR
jgi:hypothetical protein